MLKVMVFKGVDCFFKAAPVLGGVAMLGLPLQTGCCVYKAQVLFFWLLRFDSDLRVCGIDTPAFSLYSLLNWCAPI